jgi:hypothetical protein
VTTAPYAQHSTRREGATHLMTVPLYRLSGLSLLLGAILSRSGSITAAPRWRHPRDEFMKRSALLLSQRNWVTNRDEALMTAAALGLTLDACLPNGLARLRSHSRGPN